MRCSKCGSDKPVEGFSKRASSRTGFQAWCRSCMNAHSRKRAASLSIPKDNERSKICTSCGKEKPGRLFYGRRVSSDGLSNICKSCNDIKVAEWYERNPSSRHRIRTAYQEARPEVRAAGRAVERAVRRGELVAGSCERCGAGKTHAHHHISYRPENHLDIMWLCAGCHADWHSTFGAVE